MRLLGLVPPSALPPKRRTAIELPATAMSPYVGVYQLAHGLELEVTLRDGAIVRRSNTGGGRGAPLAGEQSELLRQRGGRAGQFTRDASGAVTGLILHQFGRERPAGKIR